MVSTQTIDVTAGFEDACHVDFVYNNLALGTKKVVPGGTVDAVGIPLNITESGKVFSHWSQTVNGPEFDFSTPVNEDMTLYVVTKNAWKVTFNSHGGSGVLPIYVNNGDPIGTLPASSRTGYVFQHWSLTEGGGAVAADYPVTGEVTLHAVWDVGAATSYKVVYWQENAEDDGYTFAEIDYKTGATDDPATYDPKSYTGFSFSHADDVTILGNGDTTVNVYFKRNIYTFRIEYLHENVWTFFSSTPLKYGQSTATQYNAAVGTYPYNTWYLDQSISEAFSEAPSMPDHDLTIYGVYTGDDFLYTIGYYEKDTDVEIKEPYSFYHSYALIFSSADAIDIPGFTPTAVDEWGSLQPYTPGDTPVASKIYYTRNNYTLTFNRNDGQSPLVASDIPFGSDISDKDTTGLAEDSTYVQDGVTYYFAGWYDNPAYTGAPYSLTGKTMPAHNLALYAKWTPETYTVTFYNTLDPTEGVYHTETDIVPLYTISPPAGDPQVGVFLGWYWYVGQLFVVFDFSTPIR